MIMELSYQINLIHTMVLPSCCKIILGIIILGKIILGKIITHFSLCFLICKVVVINAIATFLLRELHNMHKVLNIKNAHDRGIFLMLFLII